MLGMIFLKPLMSAVLAALFRFSETIEGAAMPEIAAGLLAVHGPAGLPIAPIGNEG
ncbi:MAG: hypothetical protein RR720_04940 [Comamonas sp.]|uniref:hypothetical protein n=1 Tax=Comamonas sp. TaxID=34028 RepID=UPI002FC7E7EF